MSKIVERLPVVSPPTPQELQHGVRYSGELKETPVYRSGTPRTRTPAQIKRGEAPERKLVDIAALMAATPTELTTLLGDVAAELKRRGGA